MFLWELRRDFLNRLLLSEADADDQIKIVLRERAQHRLKSIVISRLDVFDINAQFFFGLSRALISRGVEGFIIFTTSVEHQANFEFGRDQSNVKKHCAKQDSARKTSLAADQRREAIRHKAGFFYAL
jgi:hypothetical protein